MSSGNIHNIGNIGGGSEGSSTSSTSSPSSSELQVVVGGAGRRSRRRLADGRFVEHEEDERIESPPHFPFVGRLGRILPAVFEALAIQREAILRLHEMLAASSSASFSCEFPALPNIRGPAVLALPAPLVPTESRVESSGVQVWRSALAEMREEFSKELVSIRAALCSQLDQVREDFAGELKVLSQGLGTQDEFERLRKEFRGVVDERLSTVETCREDVVRASDVTSALSSQVDVAYSKLAGVIVRLDDLGVRVDSELGELRERVETSYVEASRLVEDIRRVAMSVESGLGTHGVELRVLEQQLEQFGDKLGSCDREMANITGVLRTIGLQGEELRKWAAAIESNVVTETKKLHERCSVFEQKSQGEVLRLGAGIERMESALEKRVGAMEAQLDAAVKRVEEKIEKRFAAVEAKRVGAMEAQLDAAVKMV